MQQSIASIVMTTQVSTNENNITQKSNTHTSKYQKGIYTHSKI
jgi:hypothetical protein